ncbi:MerR family transcriptional regulator [Microbacterium sp. cx-59]|uniref:MerR family transcriptional regulator n=1 Tax=Microbacterium sp. cx-59 TaxID=2891207 RepID=UPI001E3607ED|nr:MerR family transcriptional regulator [Microbacterium sp. cx-59]MCC4908589.1 MerR family transcriptional regulator [Microbacterium sp. cx-59]
MLSIGEFARLVGVSVRMLRHYDQLGLLRPDRVDPFTGYRSYAAVQLDEANRLVALKDLGFSLDEVGRLLADDDSSPRVAALLRARRDELMVSIEADRRRLHLVEARLRSIEKEHTVYVFIETDLPALRLVQLSARVREMADIETEIGPMFERVGAALDAAGVERRGPGVAVYTAVDDEVIAAAAEQIGDQPVPDGLERAEVAAAARALTVRYEADDLGGIQRTWQALVTEVDARGLRIAGPAREVYLEAPPESRRWVVDLQQPVA